MLRFSGPVNPMGSCQARSVYLTTRLLGRLSPSSERLTMIIVHILLPDTYNTLPSRICRENDRRKYFAINLHERMLPVLAELNLWPPGLQSTRIRQPPRPAVPRRCRFVLGLTTQLLWVTVVCQKKGEERVERGAGRWTRMKAKKRNKTPSNLTCNQG